MQVFHTSSDNPFLTVTGAQQRQATAAGAGDAKSTSSSPSSTSSGNKGTSTATITANDFLQLLVTELKNQDPTANVNPNEYVDQLVQVNSLQQEIQMNQTLDGGPTLTGASSGVLQELMQMNGTLDGDLSGASSSSPASKPAAEITHLGSGRKHYQSALTGGQNAVSNPLTEASAETVANALTANPHHETPGLPKLQIPAGQMGAFAKFAARLRANRISGAHQ